MIATGDGVHDQVCVTALGLGNRLEVEGTCRSVSSIPLLENVYDSWVDGLLLRIDRLADVLSYVKVLWLAIVDELTA